MTQCPACSNKRYVRRVAIDDSNKDRYRRFSESKYGGLLDDWMEELQPEIVFCKECGHHWYLRQPSPEQLSFMYANGRPLSSGRLTREPNQEMVNEMSQLAKLTGKMHPRLLDFGSGFGRWARAAARTGFDVYAYEPIKVRGAESVDEFTLVHDLSEIAGMQFDAVNLEQVLEHIPDPIHTLQTIKSFFSEDTILRVRVPNIFRPPEGSCVWTDWPYDGIRVHAMAPFEHLHGFTPRSLVNVIERSGYELIPLKKIWRNYPVLVARNLAGKIYPKVGQTMALAKLIN